MPHFYPRDLASFLRVRKKKGECSPGFPLPDSPLLEDLLSTCFQASLLQEEARPLRFRVVFAPPDLFDLNSGPPMGFHLMAIEPPRPFAIKEIRRLAPATEFHRTLLGVFVNQAGNLEIWGLIHSGPRWLHAVHGGRGEAQPLPLSMVINVTNPGRVSVGDGTRIYAHLNHGKIHLPAMDVFDTQWIQGVFSEYRIEIDRLHKEARARAGNRWAPFEKGFVRLLSQQFVRRIISTIRNAHHGGTIILIPREKIGEYLADAEYLNIKYPFADAEPRRRYMSLMLDILNRMGELHIDQKAPVGWTQYMSSTDEIIEQLDEGLYELAHFTASLAGVDGAVLMTKHFELLGFGVEISGSLSDVKFVAKALDAEADRTDVESTDGVGTRHRSAYRLCQALADVIAVVISQDGNIRYVGSYNGHVTYREQVTASLLDL